MLILVLFGLLQETQAADCFSTKNSIAQLIYLHGMDSPNKSEQEQEIRRVLKAISEEKQIDVFLPRATIKCPNNPDQVCWTWGSEDGQQIEKRKKQLLKDSKSCFKSTKPLLWLGFSNGGNHVLQFFQSCDKGKYLTFGSSGGYLKKWSDNLSECGQLYSAIGKKDKWNYSTGLQFYNKLQNSKAHIQIVEFDGAHELKKETLVDLLGRALRWLHF